MYREIDIDELYNHIEEGIAECENQVKNHVLEAILSYGTEEEGGKRKWKNRAALGVIREIKRAMEVTLSDGVNSKGEPAKPEQMDYLRMMYVRFIMLGRYCKDNPMYDE